MYTKWNVHFVKLEQEYLLEITKIWQSVSRFLGHAVVTTSGLYGQPLLRSPDDQKVFLIGDYFLNILISPTAKQTRCSL